MRTWNEMNSGRARIILRKKIKMENVKYNQEDIVSHHGIAAIIKNEKGEVLIQKHIKYGFWTIPVGKVKQKQKVEEALKEEIFEECNLIIENFKELTERDYIYNRDGNKVIVKSHLFEILNYSGKMKNNEHQKHKQQIFLSIDKIKELPYLSDMTLLFLETLGFKRDARI